VTAYATSTDAITLYGQSYITTLCDRDLDGNLDTTALDAHLDQATRFANSYLFGRYSTPLTIVPSTIVKVVVDIALHNAATTADVMTTILRQRYEDAVSYLRDIAANRVKLEVAVDETTANAAVTPSITTRATATFVAGSRLMSTNQTSRLT
jgi:phage gp36-like protein